MILGESMEQIAAQHELTIEETLDKMLLELWLALFLAKSDHWSRAGVANTPADEAFELGRWFLRGQAIGAKPIFDGLCARCGGLLYGEQNQNSALHNKCTGVPIDRDDRPLELTAAGTAPSDAQPPFLLRYSPQLFAREAPEIFDHDEETNALKLRPGISIEEAPWVRPAHSRHTEKTNIWLYCTSCKEYVFPRRGQGRAKRVPFRDGASQCLLKPVRRKAAPWPESGAIHTVDSRPMDAGAPPPPPVLPSSPTGVPADEQADPVQEDASQYSEKDVVLDEVFEPAEAETEGADEVEQSRRDRLAGVLFF